MMRACAFSAIFAMAATVVAVVMMHYIYGDVFVCIATGVVGATLLGLALRCVHRADSRDRIEPQTRAEMIRALCEDEIETENDQYGNRPRAA